MITNLNIRYINTYKKAPLFPKIDFMHRVREGTATSYPLKGIIAKYLDCTFTILSFSADLHINNKHVYTMHVEGNLFDNMINEKLKPVIPRDTVYIQFKSIVVRDEAGRVYVLPDKKLKVNF